MMGSFKPGPADQPGRSSGTTSRLPEPLERAMSMAKESEIGWKSARYGPSRQHFAHQTESQVAPAPGESFLKAAATSDMSLFAQDLGLRYVWTFNARHSWLETARPGSVDDEILAADAAEQTRSIKDDVLRTGTPSRYELYVTTPEGARCYDVRLDVNRQDDGRIVGLVGTSIDITQQKRREDTLKTLLRELSHRSKNLLAIIQSLASQTARHSVTVPEFLVRFRGRIQSLSSSQDIVTESDWRGADLFGLVSTQVERYAPDGMKQVRLRGQDVYLSPSAALHVGLALHELAVNAASYGSLSTHNGAVSISSEILDEGEERVLRLAWEESGGPRVLSDHDTRFGTSTLERIVPNSVGGQACLTYHPDGITYSLTVPAVHFEALEGAGSKVTSSL